MSEQHTSAQEKRPRSITLKSLPWVTFAVAITCMVLVPYGDLAALKPTFILSAFTGAYENIPQALFTLLAYAFQHSSLERLGFNLVSFSICGVLLENAIGHRRFLLFFLATAIGAGLTHVLMIPELALGVIGLSGVSMGLLAVVAYLADLLVPSRMPAAPLMARLIQLSAILVVAGQYLGMFAGPGMTGGDSNAYFLHLGSALTGIVLYLFWLRPVVLEGRQKARNIGADSFLSLPEKGQRPGK
ncbi:MAG: hypothetical protein C0469_00280 [Cyanobacteria bacterium DS2.3.42]|nr:hypothetical protein [Cyanobacteria bacterium DS2.3.42]